VKNKVFSFTAYFISKNHLFCLMESTNVGGSTNSYPVTSLLTCTVIHQQCFCKYGLKYELEATDTVQCLMPTLFQFFSRTIIRKPTLNSTNSGFFHKSPKQVVRTVLFVNEFTRQKPVQYEYFPHWPDSSQSNNS
jgi:hypothetical protein